MAKKITTANNRDDGAFSVPQYKNKDRILVAVDCIIFGFDGEHINALFIKRDFEPEMGKWSLMGGFVKKDEGVDDAAIRVLNGLTGLDNVYMEAIGCFGDTGRDPGGRVISIAYFALINSENYTEAIRSHNAVWYPLDKIPALVFDHKKMVKLAIERLREKVITHPVGFELLPAKFTLRQLQTLYEAICGYELDKGNFTKKILSLNILNRLNEKEKSSSRKGSFYFVFDEKAYKELEKDGVKFIA